MVPKADFDTKLKSLNQKVNSNKTKNLLVQNKLKIFNSFYFRDKNHFEEDSAQNYLAFQPIDRN